MEAEERVGWACFQAYGKKRWRYAVFCMFIIAAFNLYFIFLISGSSIKYLLYLDFLLMMACGISAVADCCSFVRKWKRIKELMGRKELICRVYPYFENHELAEHDVRVLEEQLEGRFSENCELQDYVAKWCHEMKIPLSAGLLMGEKIPDGRLRGGMREQLERMKQQVGALLLGCRLQGALFDLQIRKVFLKDCVRESVHNNQFFLIQKGFEMKVDAGEEMVYTDPEWIVYVLDQLMSNAVKYAGEIPVLHIWTEKKGEILTLFVEDHGAGICESEISRVFEKGFTGRNYHNGKYRSTGMGLYMAAKIIGRMGHEIGVESRYGEFSRFWIRFKKNEYFEVGQGQQAEK